MMTLREFGVLLHHQPAKVLINFPLYGFWSVKCVGNKTLCNNIGDDNSSENWNTAIPSTCGVISKRH